MTELVYLDPTAVSEGRTQLEITNWIKAEGANYGDAEISAYMADHAIGSSPVDFRLPNRKVEMPLALRTIGTTTYGTMRSNLQTKVAQIQTAGGGWLARVVDGTAIYADVMNATLHLGASWQAAYRSADTEATLALETLPDWWGPVRNLDTITGTGTTVTKLQASAADALIAGHYPGRVSIVWTETSNHDQHGLLWGFRCRHYDAATTAALAYEAEALTVPSGSAITTQSGASGGGSNNVVSRTLTSSWADVVNTNLAVGGAMTHTGSYQVWARVYASALPSIRFMWSVGDVASPVINPTTVLQLSGGFGLVDIGQIRLDPNPLGTHRWIGHVQAKGSGTLAVDQLLFQPLDDSAGQLIGYQSVLEPGQIAPAVSYALRGALLAWNGMFTLTAAGDGYMQMPETYQDLPRVPVSGMESRPVEFFFRPTRGNFADVADSGLDSMTVDISYRPSYLYLP